MAATRVTVVDAGGGLKAVRHLDPACPELTAASREHVLGVMPATATVRVLTRRCPVCFAEVERREAEEQDRRDAGASQARRPPVGQPVASVRLSSVLALSEQGAAHLVEVARCPIVESCLEGETPTHPCSTIVLNQWAGVSVEERLERWRGSHQLPEPWDGHLELAPILFVSSNPSISGSVRSRRPPELERDSPSTFMGRTVEEHPSIRRLGQGPRWVWADEEIIDRYESAFDLYIADGVAGRMPDGQPGKSTRFWVEVRSRVRELIPHRPVVPGRDYALTEVVRCKSREEIGVEDALSTCAGRYLETTLGTAAASIIVVLGRLAARAVEAQLRVAATTRVHEAVIVGGRPRWVVFLPHPNARMPRRFSDYLDDESLSRVRDSLQRWEKDRVSERNEV